jgi:hypothetical protein
MLLLGDYRLISGDAFHPALVAFGVVIVVAIGWLIWGWVRDKKW